MAITTLSPVTGSMDGGNYRWPNYSGYSIKHCIIHCPLSREMHFLLHCVWYVLRKRTLFLFVSSPGQGTCDYIYLYLCGIAAKMVAKPRLKTRNLIACHPMHPTKCDIYISHGSCSSPCPHNSNMEAQVQAK